MLAYRASKVTDPCRQVVDFSEARLVRMEGSAYLELSRSKSKDHDDDDDDDSNNNCAFCANTSRHEHSFTGRLKYDPKEGKHFVSFAGMDPGQSSTSKKSKSSLQVIPIPKTDLAVAANSSSSGVRGCGSKAAQKTTKRLKASRIYPLVTYNEPDACKTLLTVASDWAKDGDDEDRDGEEDSPTKAKHKKIVAIKIVCTEELVLVRLERARREDGLNGNCQLCLTVCEDSVESLAAHMATHGIGVRVKRMPEFKAKLSEEEEPDNEEEVLSMEYDDEHDKSICR